MNETPPRSVREPRRRRPDKPAPSLWDFADYREYLRLYLAYKRETSPGFSVRQFCLKARISTENYLLRLIRGQRKLGPRVAERIIETIPLRGNEAEYFRCLVELDLARSAGEEAEIFNRIERLRTRAHRTTIPVTDHSILHHWYLGVIWELASCAGLTLTPESAVRSLRGRISHQQAKEAIELLRAKGYLIEEGGKLVPGAVTIGTTNDRTDALLRQSHREHLLESVEALNHPVEERGFYGLTIAVNHDRLPEVKGKIKAFMDALQAELSLDPRADRVYRINAHVFGMAEAKSEETKNEGVTQPSGPHPESSG